MLRKEFVTSNYALQRITDAINAIITHNKNDYRLEENGSNTIRLFCRTRYTWGTIAEIVWSSVSEESQLDMVNECRPNPEVFLTHQLQKVDEEKYLYQLHELFLKYIEKIPVIRKQKNGYRINFKKRLGFILSTAFIAVIVTLIINSAE
jgi:hypothetical protein